MVTDWRVGWRRLIICVSLGVMAMQNPGFSPKAQGTPSSPVAAYSFSEGTGGASVDESGNNNTATLLTGATWTTTGKYGNALSFNGTSAVARINDSPTWKVNGLGGYTVSLWVKVINTSASFKAVIGTGSWPANDLFIFKDGSSWSYGLRTSGSWSCGGLTPALGYLSTADNTYHHIALVLNAPAGRCDFYSDGVNVSFDEFVNGTTSFRTGPSFNNLHIGGFNGGQYLQADVDNLRIYTSALTATEVVTDMNTPVSGTGPDTTPPTISNVTGSNITDTAATISWTTNESADSQVEYGTTTAYGSLSTLNPALVTSHSQSISGLTPSTIYHYRVRSKDAAGNVSVSPDFIFTTLALPDTTAPEITNVVSSGVTTNSAVITWTTNEQSDSQVQYGLTTAYGSSTPIGSGLVINHGQTLSSLSPNTLYHYRVLSRDGAGNLGMSGDFTFTTQPSPPDTTPPVISGVSANNVTGSSATIAWTTNEPADTQVEYGTTTAYGSVTILNPASVTAHSQGLSGLANSTLYHFRVRSRDAAGNLSISGDFTFTTLPGSVGFQDVLIVGGLIQPTSMAFAPDGRLFISEQAGKLRVLKNGQLLPTPFMTIPVDDRGESGLMGIAIDPNFATNHYIYTFYSQASGVGDRVSRFTANGDVVVPGSETVIIELTDTHAYAHNGGAIHFGVDGKLYISVGDNGGPEGAQELNSFRGKLLRINADGTIPTDNPFYNQATGQYRSVYALGFRNPFTFAIDPVTGRIFVNDVGNADWEEINQVSPGSNHGWPVCEGPQGTGVGLCNNPSFTYPIHAYPTAGIGGAIAGGAFYRGNQFPQQWVGDYFFSDHTKPWLRYLDSSNQTQGVNNPYSSFRDVQNSLDLDVGPDGALYYLSFGYGELRKIEYASGNLSPVAVMTATPASGQPPLEVSFSASGSSDPDGDPLTYSWNFGDGSPSGSGELVVHTYTTAGPYTATLTVSDGRGGVSIDTEQITVGSPPTASILTPTAGATYSGGDVINFSGSATDPEDGALPASAFSWRVLFHHNEHTHPFLGPLNGVNSGSFQIPTDDHTESTVWYRLYLTVTDSNGLKHEVTRDILPNKVTLTLQSNIPGLSLTLDGQPLPAPLAFESVVGVRRLIGAPSPQTVDGNQYSFVSWSDGGGVTHTIATPATATVYTATFQQTGPITTPWFYPTAQSAVTSGAGDNNGYEGTPDNMLADDGVFATDTNSGTNNNTNCANSGKDRHIVRDFTLTLPAGATTVNGIAVRLDGKVESASNAPRFCVQLSWNGGLSWTSAKSTPTLTTAEQTFILGGVTDKWGRGAWTSAELSNANFRVRVSSVASSGARDFSLDVVGVRVTAQ